MFMQVKVVLNFIQTNDYPVIKITIASESLEVKKQSSNSSYDEAANMIKDYIESYVSEIILKLTEESTEEVT